MRWLVVVQLTEHQAFRCEKLGECLWLREKLSVEEISRRLLLLKVNLLIFCLHVLPAGL